jgi:hypothetical protein
MSASARSGCWRWSKNFETGGKRRHRPFDTSLQPEQQVRKPLGIREGDQMASREHLRVDLYAIPSDMLLELKGKEAIVR